MTQTIFALLVYGAFLVLGIPLYLVFPKRYKWTVLLALSIAGIIALTSYWAIFVFVLIAITYITTRLMDKNIKKFKEIKDTLSKDDKKAYKKKYKKNNKIIVLTGVIIAALVLALLKYFNLPLGTLNNLFEKYSFGIWFPILGISYYTLIAISYMVDCYNEKYEVEHNIFKVALFISFLPSMLEGPFNRYNEMNTQLYKEDNPSYDLVVNGILTIAFGIFLKMVVSDRIALIVDPVFKDYEIYDHISILVAMVLYVFKLYFDFLGFIKLAEGVALCFGIKLHKNFDTPLLSLSVGEFWRRWHITLGAWLKDYIFYPIALSKPVMAISKKAHARVAPIFEGVIISAIPLFFVWLVCGIWHGAGIKYVVYGMYYFVIILLEMITDYRINRMENKPFVLKMILWARTFIIIVIGLAIFKSKTLTDFGLMMKALAVGNGTTGFWTLLSGAEIGLMFVVTAIACLINVLVKYKPQLSLDNLNPWLKMAAFTVVVIVILLFGCYGATYVGIDPEYAAF